MGPKLQCPKVQVPQQLQKCLNVKLLPDIVVHCSSDSDIASCGSTEVIECMQVNLSLGMQQLPAQERAQA